jgi:hypothetical protein
MEFAEMLELNRVMTNKVEALREADAEEARKEVIEALRERLLKITEALNRMGPFTEPARSKKRRARKQAREGPVDEGQAEVG